MPELHQRRPSAFLAAMTSKLMQQLSRESLSTRLLPRTTRQVNPTGGRASFTTMLLALLAELEETHSQLTHNSQQPQGTPSSRCPWIGYLHLSPALPLFRERYPGLEARD